MLCTFNIPHSVSALKKNIKIYKKPLLDVAYKSVEYWDMIQAEDDRKYKETIKYLNRVLLGKENKE